MTPRDLHRVIRFKQRASHRHADGVPIFSWTSRGVGSKSSHGARSERKEKVHYVLRTPYKHIPYNTPYGVHVLLSIGHMTRRHLINVPLPVRAPVHSMMRTCWWLA